MRQISFFKKTFLVMLISCFTFFNCKAQQPKLTTEYKNSVIKKAKIELQNIYVYPKVATKISSKLDELNKEGYFNSYKSLNSFAEAVSKVIYDISKDKHISVTLKSKTNTDEKEEKIDPMEEWLNSRLEERTYYRQYNANFKTIEKKKGNIGYLDLRGFYGLDFGKDFATYAMAMLGTSDAIIIDLRNNSGGRGDMVNFLLSHFFDESIITGKSLRRKGDNYIEKVSKTQKRELGTSYPEVPLFILTSRKTFSAAEAFAYPLRVYKRAILIGETTKGGANPGNLISINDDLEIFIPDVAGLPHPVSKEIFEGEGIIPDIEVDSDKALEVALEEANKAAKDYKEKQDAKAKALLVKLNEVVGNYNGKNEDEIVNIYLECRKNNLVFEEWELNSLGHQLKESGLKTAIAIFKTATVIYPHSAIALDNYATSLLKNNEKEKAIEYYEKAVQVANENNDEFLNEIKSNLEAARKSN